MQALEDLTQYGRSIISKQRALEHSLQHLLLCMHRSSALAAVARILGFRLGFVGRL
jgi:hypothetical protein